MKHIILAFGLCLLSAVSVTAQDHYATCKVVERKQKVKFEFTKEVKYLGSDYEKTIIFFRGKRMSFNDGQEAVAYLSASWGWVLCGNPVQLKDGATIWVMRHEVDKNIVNYTQNVRAYEESRKRYGDKDNGSFSYYNR